MVHKFGGSSLADAACFRRVAAIVESEQSSRIALVLSACQGVTDLLIRLVESAEGGGPPAIEASLRLLGERHEALAAELLTGAARSDYRLQLQADLADLGRLLQAVGLVRSAGRELQERVAGYGELWSSRLFAALLAERNVRQDIHWLDAREVIRVEWTTLGPGVRWSESEACSARCVPAGARTLVIPGYVATDARGLQTTLGRNGSDFSASIFGSLLDAAGIVIWTDVDGVLSADPRQVPDAKVIDRLSYDEAMELAYFGAKVIHPQTMAPAIGKGIPIRIRNSFA
jgi:aspartokinase/homoserine dehydrogenase 1